MFGSKNGEKYEKKIPYHKCTAEDYDKFAPPAADSENLIKIYKTNPNRNLYCVDWEKYAEEL